MKRTLNDFFTPTESTKKPRLQQEDVGKNGEVLQDLSLSSLKKKVPRINLTSSSWVDVYRVPDAIALTTDEFEELWKQRPVERGKVKIMGNLVTTPRWSQTYGVSYFYTGVLHEAKPMIPIIQRLMDWCKGRTPTLTGCLVNWYERGADYIGPHSDSETNLIPGSEIYSLSFGSTREFSFYPKDKSSMKTTVILENKTLVIMGGTCQKTHKHTVPKATEPCGRRINITFRSFK